MTGVGRDGGQARWMTQFTVHRPGIKCQFTVTPPESMAVCASLRRGDRVFTDFPFNEAIFTSR